MFNKENYCVIIIEHGRHTMELELFDFIEESIEILEKNHSYLIEKSSFLEQFFTENFMNTEGFLSINSRVKSENSFREKIIRNNLYMKNASPESVFMSIQDIIGLRIECRFIEDEHKIFDEIIEQFSIISEDGYYSSKYNKNIFLKLRDTQPQLQKNGFEIYKIDGYIFEENRKLNFELQVKSLVNVFWGEIDHRILYKNYNYMISEDFFRDIMHSIKDNLSMIDRQLMILYDHVNKMDSSAEQSNRIQVKSLLSKIIHDIYVGKIHKKLGFIIDFGFATDVIVEYLYYKCEVVLKYDYGENFIRLLNRINKIADYPIDLQSHILFTNPPIFLTNFSEKLGNSIYKNINIDFGWNLFFKIISQIEHSDPIVDLEGFISFMEQSLRTKIKYKLRNINLSTTERETVVEYILSEIVLDLSLNNEMDYVLDSCFSGNKYNLGELFRNINNYEDFLLNRERIKRSLERGPIRNK